MEEECEEVEEREESQGKLAVGNKPEGNDSPYKPHTSSKKLGGGRGREEKSRNPS